MSMPWFKTYPEARTDLKLKSLSRVQRSVWFDLLCYAAEQPDRGVIRFEDERLLAIEVADGDVSLLNETLERLQAVRIITIDAALQDENGAARRCITFVAFAKRQGFRAACNAKSSTERARKCRLAKKLKGDAAHAAKCSAAAADATRATTDRDREEEREKRDTPLTPQGGMGDGGISLASQKDSAPLLSQRQSTATPEQVDKLIDWARTVVGDRGEIEDYYPKLPGWVRSFPIGWIETAVLCTAANASRLKPGGLAAYTFGCLKNWHPDGPPKDKTITAQRQRESIERSTIPLNYVSDPEYEAEIRASYGAKARRAREAKAKAAFDSPSLRRAVNQ